MQQDRPEIRPNEILIIRNVEEDFYVILEIRRTLYRAHYMPTRTTREINRYAQAPPYR